MDEPSGDLRFLSRVCGPLAPHGINPRVRELHRSLPGYRETALHECPSLAARLGVATVYVKDETLRMGLPAFKVLGASWAAHCALETQAGGLADASAGSEMLQRGPAPLPYTLVSATDGNHGRALARVARWFGVGAEIFVPHATTPERIGAVQAEGASVVVVAGSYDDAVAAAEASRTSLRLIVADAGAGRSASDVIEGYSTIAAEIGDQFSAQESISAVFLQMGVGAFAASMLRFLPGRGACAPTTRFIGVEPRTAACVMESLERDAPTFASDPHTSVMVGLNCGEVSAPAWPVLRAGLGACLAIDDHYVSEALQLLRREGVRAGESGAAGLAGALAACDRLDIQRRAEAGLTADARLLFIVTEGITDADLTRRLLDDVDR